MRLPLLLVANPKTTKSGPVVRLFEGRWRVVRHGILDTTLRIARLPLTSEDKEIVDYIDGPVTLQCSILKAGTERNISLYVERV